MSLNTISNNPQIQNTSSADNHAKQSPNIGCRGGVLLFLNKNMLSKDATKKEKITHVIRMHMLPSAAKMLTYNSIKTAFISGGKKDFKAAITVVSYLEEQINLSKWNNQENSKAVSKEDYQDACSTLSISTNDALNIIKSRNMLGEITDEIGITQTMTSLQRLMDSMPSTILLKKLLANPTDRTLLYATERLYSFLVKNKTKTNEELITNLHKNDNQRSCAAIRDTLEIDDTMLKTFYGDYCTSDMLHTRLSEDMRNAKLASLAEVIKFVKYEYHTKGAEKPSLSRNISTTYNIIPSILEIDKQELEKKIAKVEKQLNDHTRKSDQEPILNEANDTLSIMQHKLSILKTKLTTISAPTYQNKYKNIDLEQSEQPTDNDHGKFVAETYSRITKDYEVPENIRNTGLMQTIQSQLQTSGGREKFWIEEEKYTAMTIIRIALSCSNLDFCNFIANSPRYKEMCTVKYQFMGIEIWNYIQEQANKIVKYEYNDADKVYASWLNLQNGQYATNAALCYDSNIKKVKKRMKKDLQQYKGNGDDQINQMTQDNRSLNPNSNQEFDAASQRAAVMRMWNVHDYLSWTKCEDPYLQFQAPQVLVVDIVKLALQSASADAFYRTIKSIITSQDSNYKDVDALKTIFHDKLCATYSESTVTGSAVSSTNVIPKPHTIKAFFNVVRFYHENKTAYADDELTQMMIDGSDDESRAYN